MAVVPNGGWKTSILQVVAQQDVGIADQQKAGKKVRGKVFSNINLCIRYIYIYIYIYNYIYRSIYKNIKTVKM